jgi:hypothetical protein
MLPAVAAPVLASSSAGWWRFGGLGVFIWLLLLIFLGIRTLRHGHWVIFLIGLVLPIAWLFGAFIPSRR